MRAHMTVIAREIIGKHTAAAGSTTTGLFVTAAAAAAAGAAIKTAVDYYGRYGDETELDRRFTKLAKDFYDGGPEHDDARVRCLDKMRYFLTFAANFEHQRVDGLTQWEQYYAGVVASRERRHNEAFANRRSQDEEVRRAVDERISAGGAAPRARYVAEGGGGIEVDGGDEDEALAAAAPAAVRDAAAS